MKQAISGLLFLIILMLPPVSNFMESIMIVHMHMQMPFLVIAGFFIAKFFQLRYPQFFERWNHNGVPGIVLFMIIMAYWMLPRAMDESLTEPLVQLFKFFSLPFLAGVPLRDSWRKLTSRMKGWVFGLFTLSFFGMGWLYIYSPVQLCNNYVLLEQVILGWGYLTMGICLAIYLLYDTIIDKSAYE